MNVSLYNLKTALLTIISKKTELLIYRDSHQHPWNAVK